MCRHFRKKDLQAEVARFVDLYKTVLERNWGFVPLTEKEVYHYAKDLKPILDENWAMFADAKTETGIREVEMSPELVEVILAHIDRLRRYGRSTPPRTTFLRTTRAGG